MVFLQILGEKIGFDCPLWAATYIERTCFFHFFNKCGSTVISSSHILFGSRRIFRSHLSQTLFFVNYYPKFNQTSFRMCMSGIYMHTCIPRSTQRNFKPILDFKPILERYFDYLEVSAISNVARSTELPDCQGCQIPFLNKKCLFCSFSTNF